MPPVPGTPPVQLLANARIVRPEGAQDGWLRVADGRIAQLGTGPSTGFTGSGEDRYDLGGRYIVPGFVDMHVHGGAGGSYQTTDPGEARAVRDYHLARGTTTMVASLVTGPLDELAAAIRTLVPLCEAGELAGIHLEGPYIAGARCGAHNPAYLRTPDPHEMAGLLEAGHGQVKMITVAPELPGALELIRDCVQAGVIAAIGHTEATYDQATAALYAGARVATHLFNGMGPLGHREPGPAGAALDDPRIVVELINDGVHVAAPMIRLVFRAAGAGRVALITDAMAAAGMGDGNYRLGSMDVEVRDGAATVADGGAIAGSTITMATAFRRAVQVVGLPIDVAATAASRTPAQTLGLADRVGSLDEGKDADLVVLDDELEVTAVMRRGRWIRGHRAAAPTVG